MDYGKNRIEMVKEELAKQHLDMKTERLYEDRKIVLEKFDNNDYRVTFFKDDGHWRGDITFNDKLGVIHDDVKDLDKAPEYTYEQLATLNLQLQGLVDANNEAFFKLREECDYYKNQLNLIKKIVNLK